MEGFIDIHTHLLPGVDDGAQNRAEALKLIRMAYENGTRAIVLTPHFRGRFKKNTPEMLQAVFEDLSEAVKQELPEMELFLGNEAYYEQELPELLAQKRVLSLNNTDYCLLEFSPGVLRSQVITGVSEVIRYGFTPIIAHAERYDVLRKSSDLLDEVLDMGALIQLNADSVIGNRGFAVKLFCNRLLKKEKVHFIATDAHDDKNRTPLLRECFLHINKKFGTEYAHQLFLHNPRTVIEAVRTEAVSLLDNL